MKHKHLQSKGQDLMLDFQEVVGIPIVASGVQDIISACLTRSDSQVVAVNCMNAHSYELFRSNDIYREAMTNSEVILPDGSGVVFASWLASGKTLSKLSGYDFFEAVMTTLHHNRGSVFFLGGTPSSLERILERSMTDYPQITVSGFSPPFKESFSESDVTNFAKLINQANPDFIFVGLGAPKQEILLNQLKNKLTGGVAAGVGAVFDFYAGVDSRAKPIFIKLHLEWLFRLLSNPRRIWRRVFISQVNFVIRVFAYDLGIRLALNKSVKNQEEKP